MGMLARFDHVTLQHRRPLWSTLFPYTTLFRSGVLGQDGDATFLFLVVAVHHPLVFQLLAVQGAGQAQQLVNQRSEEHTSELQSRENLVCRLLLETKKTKTSSTPYSYR